MKSLIIIITLILVFSAVSIDTYSQNDEYSINFYLDCEDCDLTFIRRELPFVSFVRDPLHADVHILVTDSQTASGGHKYYINFIGKNELAKTDYEYIATVNQDDTNDDVRRILLKTLKVGMLQYYSKTDLLERININIEDNEGRKADEIITDPWKNWIFQIESGGEFQKEERQNEFSLATEATIQKTTEKWKGGIEAIYEINRENYYDDGNRISAERDSREISVRYIKSITERWSARIYGEYSSRTFLNIRHKYSSSAAVEYNFFPWNDSHRRILAIRYDVAVATYDYFEETIFDKTEETLFSESLELHMELIQPWGQISVGLEGRHLFGDFSKNQLSLESDISMNLSKNISVFSSFQTDMIHDQLYLPKGDASLEDILLKRRKLATTYEMSGQLGLRFTFGSIYNNVVNERF